MELSPKAQTVELIRQANRILIISHVDADGDAIGSVLALKGILEKIGKKVEAVIPGVLDETFSFLKGFNEIKPKIEGSNNLIITLDTRETGEDLQLGWKRMSETHQVKIVITPPKGQLTSEDVKVERDRPKFDLVILLDCGSLERLMGLEKDHSALFYETTTISIDHHVTNTFFAKVNWVDLTATSTSEMLVALIESLGRDEPLLDAASATCLLTGIITDTNSFQNINTTPKSLTVAAQLVAAGANHQQIVEKINLKKLETLKLWGKALSRIVEEKEGRFLWTAVTEEDIKEQKVNGSISGLVDELLKTVGEVDFVLLLSEKGGYIDGNLRSVNKDYDVSALAKQFNGGGHKAAAGFQIQGKLSEHKEEILSKIRAFQGNIKPNSVAQEGVSA